MGLVLNRSTTLSAAGRIYGGANTYSLDPQFKMRNAGEVYNRNSGQNWSKPSGGLPSGLRPQAAFVLPLADGGMDGNAFIINISTGRGTSGLSAVGSSTITNTSAAANLALYAFIRGNATTVNSSVAAQLGAAIRIAGSATVLSTVSSALLGARVAVVGSATLVMSASATIKANGSMAGASYSYPDLSVPNIAQAVWSQPSESNQAYGKQVRDIRAVLLGKTSGAGTSTETFLAADGTTTRVTSSNDGTNRTNVVVPGT